MPNFSLDPASSSLAGSGLHPADVLVPGPSIHTHGNALGLLEDLAGGLFDNLDALSYGDDPITRPLYFSVDRVAIGVAGTDVNQQALPGVEEAAGDVYVSLPPVNNNSLFVDEEDWGLDAPATFGDDLDALELDSEPHPFFYFSVDALSESVFSAGLDPADILISTGNGTLSVFAPKGTMGLGPLDDLDALVLYDVFQPGILNPGIDMALFSLSTFSLNTWTGSGSTYAPCIPTQTSPADVCFTQFQNSYTLFASAASLGLRDHDELDALDTIPEPFTPALLITGLLTLFVQRRLEGLRP